MTSTNSLKSPILARSPVILLRQQADSQGVIKSPRLKGSSLEITDDEVLDEVVDIIKTEERKRWIKGLFYMFLVVFTWVFSLQLSNNVLKGGEYQHPLFMAYINGSFFLIFGLGKGLTFLKTFARKTFKRLVGGETFVPSSNAANNYGACQSSVDPQEDEIIIHAPSLQLTTTEILVLAVEAAFIYFGTTACGTIALKYTSASNQTIITTISSAFTLLLGSVLKIESFSVAKLISVVVSIMGTSLVTFTDVPSNYHVLDELKNSTLGDGIAICGAFLYACFLVLLRLKMGKETNAENEKLIFSLIGVATLILLIPILFIADWLNFEELSLPESNAILLMILISGLLNCISDYCSIIASLLTSPLLTSLSLSTAIPVNMICDSIFYKVTNTSFLYYLGIIMIFSSFIFANMFKEDESIQEAIDEAIEEAITNDEMLSPLLSPYLHQHLGSRSAEEIPGMNINSSISTGLAQNNTRMGPTGQVFVTGGHNHKYFIREVSEN